MDATTRPSPDAGRTIDALTALLHGERSAVETYTQAIAKFGAEAPYELNDCQRSHRDRVERLVRRLAELGGHPPDGSGLWGTFAKLVEGGAALFGRANALAALEEGEDHGIATYRERLDDVDGESRRLIEAELLPAQLMTHDVMRNLCRAAA